MKLFITILILATLSQLNFAQDNTTAVPPADTNTTEPVVEPDYSIQYVELDASVVENTPLILSLINYGSQYVISQAFDSGLLSASSGNYTKIYHVYQNATDSLNISAVVQLTASDNTKLNAKFIAHFDPTNELKTILAFSYENQNYTINAPSGINVSYNASTDQYNVTQFNGFNEWLNYQAGNATPASYNTQDYLTNYVGYDAISIAEIYSNRTIQGSSNVGLEGVQAQASAVGLLVPTAGDLNVTEINSINTISNENGGNLYRFDVQVENNDQSGQVVYVVLCPSTIANDEECRSGSLQYYWFQSIQGA